MIVPHIIFVMFSMKYFLRSLSDSLNRHLWDWGKGNSFFCCCFVFVLSLLFIGTAPFPCLAQWIIQTLFPKAFGVLFVNVRSSLLLDHFSSVKV